MVAFTAFVARKVQCPLFMHVGWVGLASLSERLPPLLALLRQQITVFLTAATIKSILPSSAISPKADLQGGVGNFVWGVDIDHKNPSQASKSHHGTRR